MRYNSNAQSDDGFEFLIAYIQEEITRKIDQ